MIFNIKFIFNIMKNYFYDLPKELKYKIYEFDSTYKSNFDIVLKEYLKNNEMFKFWWNKRYSIRIKTF